VAVGEASAHIDARKTQLNEATLTLCSDAVAAIMPHCKPGMGIQEVTGALSSEVEGSGRGDKGVGFWSLGV
jgi:hypothetical protein